MVYTNAKIYIELTVYVQYILALLAINICKVAGENTLLYQVASKADPLLTISVTLQADMCY